MEADLMRLDGILRRAAALPVSGEEPTFLSVGGRGHFEKPITDLLAFFLNPKAAHGLENVVLQALLRTLGVDGAWQASLRDAPKREEITANLNRIDLILVGEGWVVVIENKVRHEQVNPFEDYSRHVRERFPDMEILQVVLSPKGDSAPSGWSPIGFSELVTSIRDALKELSAAAGVSKWRVFLEDFLLHLENEASERVMSKDEVAFVESNYGLIARVVDMRDQYRQAVQQWAAHELQDEFPEHVFFQRVHSWPAGEAIRFYADNWGGTSESNVTLYLGHEEEVGFFEILVYLNNPGGLSTLSAGAFGPDMSYSTESGRWQIWKLRKPMQDFRGMATTLRRLARELDAHIAENGLRAG